MKKKIEVLKNFKKKINFLGFSVAMLFQFVARFARVKIEDSNRNRFALNGIQRGDFIRIPKYDTIKSMFSIETFS